MFIYLHKLLCKKKAERKQNFCKINEKKVFDIFIYKTFFFLIKIHFNFPEFFFFHIAGYNTFSQSQCSPCSSTLSPPAEQDTRNIGIEKTYPTSNDGSLF